MVATEDNAMDGEGNVETIEVGDSIDKETHIKSTTPTISPA